MSDTRAMEASATPLQFDASFESGNLAEARLIAEVPLEYDLHIRPDTLNSRHRVWFYFAVRGATRGQKVIFNLIGYSKTKSLYRDGMAPVVCTSARPHWERMPESSVYYYKSPRHGKHYVLSFPFCFDRKDARKEEVYYFAYCFPYTYSYLQRFLHSLDAAQLPCYRRECLCRTVQHRRLDLVTISSPANLALDAAAKRHRGRRPPLPPEHRRNLVFISSRVHPGETPASYLMHGLLLFLTSDHARAQALREAVVVKLVPMRNPDPHPLALTLSLSLSLTRTRTLALALSLSLTPPLTRCPCSTLTASSSATTGATRSASTSAAS